MHKNYNRRKLIKAATAGGIGVGLGLKATVAISNANPVQKVKE